ncbi:MAG: hypothetical protein QE267_11510 [Akkermansiaceae bacterium]|nr:hypothetical protein [Akkermansiaceae bacterium]
MQDNDTPAAKASEITSSKPKKKGAAKKAAKKIAKQKRPFPVVALEEAIGIPQKIKELNGGNPWPPADIAKALDKSPKTNPFFYLAAGARDYGFTEGTRDTEKISLTDLGRKFVYAGNCEEERLGLQEAFFSVSIFKDVYNHYKGSTLPELKYLGNTLKAEFKLNAEHHEDFHRLFQANCRFIQKYGEFGDSTPDSPPGTKSVGITGSNVITLASPKAGAKFKIFVALPFSEKSGKWPKGFFSEVLNALITPAGVDAGFQVETARKDGSDIIQATIVNELLNADLVVADLTDHNPNVLFELGLRMAFGKPVALIRAEGTAPIFDVDSMLRVWEYTPNLWRSTLESDIPALTAHLKGAWENRKTGKSYMQLLKEQ